MISNLTAGLWAFNGVALFLLAVSSRLAGTANRPSSSGCLWHPLSFLWDVVTVLSLPAGGLLLMNWISSHEDVATSTLDTVFFLAGIALMGAMMAGSAYARATFRGEEHRLNDPPGLGEQLRWGFAIVLAVLVGCGFIAALPHLVVMLEGA